MKKWLPKLRNFASRVYGNRSQPVTTKDSIPRVHSKRGLAGSIISGTEVGRSHEEQMEVVENALAHYERIYGKEMRDYLEEEIGLREPVTPPSK